MNITNDYLTLTYQIKQIIFHTEVNLLQINLLNIKGFLSLVSPLCKTVYIVFKYAKS